MKSKRLRSTSSSNYKLPNGNLKLKVKCLTPRCVAIETQPVAIIELKPVWSGFTPNIFALKSDLFKK